MQCDNAAAVVPISLVPAVPVWIDICTDRVMHDMRHQTGCKKHQPVGYDQRHRLLLQADRYSYGIRVHAVEDKLR